MAWKTFVTCQGIKPLFHNTQPASLQALADGRCMTSCCENQILEKEKHHNKARINKEQCRIRHETNHVLGPEELSSQLHTSAASPVANVWSRRIKTAAFTTCINEDRPTSQLSVSSQSYHRWHAYSTLRPSRHGPSGQIDIHPRNRLELEQPWYDLDPRAPIWFPHILIKSGTTSSVAVSTRCVCIYISGG